MVAARVRVTREEILAFRRRVSALDERMPPGAASLRVAASAGLTDSMPRAAVLSIHARVDDTEPETWADPALVQVWGPRFSVYVVPADAVAPFTLGRLDEPGRSRRKADEIADIMSAHLAGRRMRDRDLMAGIGIGNGIRYAGPTGRFLIRWEGARAPTVWEVPAPAVAPGDARLDLARRYIHVFGPTDPTQFAHWAGISDSSSRTAFDGLAGELTVVTTPIGDRWMLSSDEPAIRAKPRPAAPARLLPSGDTFYLLWGTDRELLVPDATRRAELWTSRVWPGAVLVDGEIVGTWRRANEKVSIAAWRRLTPSEREAVESEAASLPLPDLRRAIVVRWDGLA